jgi:hypothetical protein
MHHIRGPWSPVLLLVAAACTAPAAHAYIDPGVGSMLVQALIAAFAAAAAGIGIFWDRVRGLFGSRPPETEDPRDDKDT